MKQMNFPPTHTDTQKALHVLRPIYIYGKKGIFLTIPHCKLKALP